MPIPHVPFYKRMLSYFYPVRIKHASSTVNEVLEIHLYCGQWQLATIDALYSDGNRYRPLVAAFARIKNRLPHMQSVLVLGTGLGSAVKILNDKGYYPQTTLVDIDIQVLTWAVEFAEPLSANKITPVCADAGHFVQTCNDHFDMIIVDVFKGRYVPDFVTQLDFLKKCSHLLNKGGCLVLNYIINNDREWDATLKHFGIVFPAHEVIKLDINRIFVATV